MKRYNLYQRLKPELKNELNKSVDKYPDLVKKVVSSLRRTGDVQKLELGEWASVLVLLQDVVDRHEMNYIEIFYGDSHFMTNEETVEYRKNIKLCDLGGEYTIAELDNQLNEQI